MPEMINPNALLIHIQDMLEENRAAMKCSGTNSDYLDGANTALRRLLYELGIATWEETCD